MSARPTDVLLARARHVLPNGVFGHRRSFAFVDGAAIGIPPDYPHFVESASGCRFRDADGRTFIDYLCGYGPMIAGYGNARIDAAFVEEQRRGVCYSFPATVEIELAEHLVARHVGMAFSAFSLNGTDAISLALAIARDHTGRAPLVIAEGAYHGNLPAVSTGPGRIDADRASTRVVPWGDEDALRVALEHGGPAAAVLLCPYDQRVGAPNRLPEPGYWSAVRRLCDATGTLLILDDVRSGFRLHPRGSAARFDISPDLICVSKAMANGYPIAATLGRTAARESAERVFVTGTFWSFAPAQAAALATLRLLDESDACAHLDTMGRRLTDGLRERALAHGFSLSISGPSALPLVLFEDDPGLRLARGFARAMAQRGSLIHPTHNWFLSLAHGPDDIDATLAQAEDALRDLRTHGPDVGG